MFKLTHKPLKYIVVTQKFGENFADFYKKLGLAGHNGIDLRTKRRGPGDDYGDEIFAMHDGVVKFAGEYEGYGINVLLETVKDFGGIKYQTIYAHLQATSGNIAIGKTVQGGELLGYADNTGKFTTGEHLHIGLYSVDLRNVRQYYNNNYFGALDPAPFFEDRGWDLLPVQKRYGRFYDPTNPGKRPWHAYLSEKKVALSLTRYLRRLPTNEQINACTYGAWPRDWVANDAFYPIYAWLKKDEYEAGQRPPLPLSI